ncbi:MAG: biotin transporter BioY [Natronospirillum sp.]
MNDKTFVLIHIYAALMVGIDSVFTSYLPYNLDFLLAGSMLAGAMLGPWRGAASMLLLIIWEAYFVPFWNGDFGFMGFGTGRYGHLLTFPVVAFATGYMAFRLRHLPKFPAALLSSLFGSTVELTFSFAFLILRLGGNWMEAIAAFPMSSISQYMLCALFVGLVAQLLPRAFATEALERGAYNNSISSPRQLQHIVSHLDWRLSTILPIPWKGFMKPIELGRVTVYPNGFQIILSLCLIPFIYAFFLALGVLVWFINCCAIDGMNWCIRGLARKVAG